MLLAVTACRPAEPPVQPPAITSQEDTALQFTVTWVSDVELATTLTADCGELVVELTESAPRTDHRAEVLGLWDGATCEVVISGEDADGEPFQTDPKTYTAAVHPDLPTLEILEHAGGLAPGWTLLTMAREGASSPGGAAVIDDEGRFRWFHPRWQGSPAPGFDARTVPLADPAAQGILDGADTAVLIGGFGAGFGPAMVSWTQETIWEGALDMHHEIAPFGGDALVYLGYDTCEGYETNALYSLDLVSGAKDFTWRSCDHLAPQGLASEDWDHLNSFDVLGADGTGDLVMTARNMDLLVYVERETGAVAWTAGELGTIPVTGEDVFLGPHAVQSLGDDHFLFLDNGEPGVRESTRVVELAVDPVAGTAEVVWSWDTGMFAPILGDANRLENGNTLVVIGTADISDSHLFEVSAAGELLWHVLVTEGWTPNRAERIAAPPTGLLLE
jgi:hypothetical protein